MPRKKKLSPADIEAREREILSKPVNPTGAGEDPAVKAILSPEFVTGSNMDALQMALAFQQLLKGQASLLDNQSKYSDALERITARMDAYDRDAIRWETDRKAFLEEMNRMADRVRVTDAQREVIQANGANDLARRTEEARAQIVMDKKHFDTIIDSEPKVRVVSAGILETVMENGVAVSKLFPEEIRIKHRRWVLPPGKIVEVPASVAARLEERRKSQAETAERQQAMMANMESGELARRMKEIDEKYKTSTAHLGESNSVI